MKHYEKLLALGCVTRSQLEQVTGSPSAADWLCREYQRKGYMERIKRNLYPGSAPPPWGLALFLLH